MDVHQATISVAVRDAAGKLVMESIVETKAATILQFIQGIHGSLWVIFEEGTRTRNITGATLDCHQSVPDRIPGQLSGGVNM